MKDVVLFFAVCVLAGQAYGQASNSQLEAWFEAGEYDKINAQAASDTLAFWQARVMLREYRDGEALAAFDAILAKNKSYADAHFYRAVALLGANNLPEAAKAVDAAIKLDGKRALYFALRGDICKGQSQQDSAAYFYEKAILLPNCPPAAFEHAAATYLEKNEYNKALKIQRLYKNYLDHDSLLGRRIPAEDYDFLLYSIADNELKTGQHKSAEATLIQLHQRKPDNYQVLTKLIQVYHAKPDLPKAQALEARLDTAWRAGLLPENMRERYCKELTITGKNIILAYQHFVPDATAKHTVYSWDISQGADEYTLQLEYAADQSSAPYTIFKYQGKEIIRFPKYTYATQPSYNNMRQIVLKIVNQKIKPTNPADNKK